MIYRKLGRTDLDVSLISLGGGVFNRNKDPLITLEKTSEAINFAVENGINLIDIGKEYDEEFIGKAMGNNKKKIHIVARSEAKDGENLLNDIKDSINKLGVKPIPIYEVWECNENILEALKKAKKMGLIKCAGIFNHRIDVVEKAIKTGEFEVTTILYNLVHRMAEKIFPLAKKLGIGVIAAAPLATGILAKPKYEGDIQKINVEKMTVENALKFVLSNDAVHTALIGLKDSQQIKESIEVVKDFQPFTKSEIKKLIKNVEGFLGRKFCRMCRYCECPIGIPIPDLLKLYIRATRYGYLSFAKWQYSNQQKKAELCTKCGICEKKCPYSLPIIKMLEETHQLLS